MFQTDLHLWLQAFFNADWMLPAMTAVSALGYAPAYILLIAVCAFGIRLRPGLGLMLAIVLMSGVTSLAKHAADLPRPSDIDARVLDKGRSGRHLIEQGTVQGFWSLPSEAAIARYRADEDRDPGLPSGHVGVATAATVAVLLAFAVRSAWWRTLLLLGWPALMALSRMYLGRHFLADVLAGWLLGIALALLAVALMPRPHPVATGNRWRLVVLGGLALAGTAYASQHTWLGVDVAGQLAGLTVVLCWLQWRGWPPAPQRLWQRVLGPVLFIGLNLLAEPVISPIAGWLPLPDVRATEVWWHFVGTAGVLMVAITVTGWINARHRPVDANRHSTEPRVRQLSAAMPSAAHPQHTR